jgi:hypothetical protein
LIEDYNSLDIEGVDAYIDIAPISVGYKQSERGGVAYEDIGPILEVVVRLISAKTKEVLYADTITYGWAKTSVKLIRSVNFESPPEHQFINKADLKANKERAIQQLIQGIEKVSLEIARNFSRGNWYSAKIASLSDDNLSDLNIGSDDELLFLGMAAAEITSKSYDKALWDRALALAEGDEQKRKGIYIKLRSEQLALEKKDAQQRALEKKNTGAIATRLNGEQAKAHLTGRTEVWTKGGAYYGADGTMSALWKGRRRKGDWEVSADGNVCYYLTNWPKLCQYYVNDAGAITMIYEGKSTGVKIMLEGNRLSQIEANPSAVSVQPVLIKQPDPGPGSDEELLSPGQAAAEITSKSYDQAIWEKALALADGDEQKRDGIYIKLRSEQLALVKKGDQAIANLGSNQNNNAVLIPKITGIYSSEIKGIPYNDKKRYSKLKIVQNGNKITGSFAKGQRKFEGIIEGDTFVIYWIDGWKAWEVEFKVSPDNQIAGKYFFGNGSRGQWNLHRLVE